MDGGAWKAAVHGVAEGRTRLSDFTFTHWRRKWQPTPVFLSGESQDGGAWWAAVYGVTQSQTRLKRLSSSRAGVHGEGNGNPLQYSCLENPRTGEPGGLPSMGSHRVGHDCSDLAAAAAAARCHCDVGHELRTADTHEKLKKAKN